MPSYADQTTKYQHDNVLPQQMWGIGDENKRWRSQLLILSRLLPHNGRQPTQHLEASQPPNKRTHFLLFPPIWQLLRHVQWHWSKGVPYGVLVLFHFTEPVTIWLSPLGQEHYTKLITPVISCTLSLFLPTEPTSTFEWRWMVPGLLSFIKPWLHTETFVVGAVKWNSEVDPWHLTDHWCT